jgi:aminodeoxyfutalosine synthase
MLDNIGRKVMDGERLDRKDAMALMGTDDIFALGEMASIASERHNANRAYFVRNIHVNPTNIFVNRGRFCAFSRSKGEQGAYEMSTRQIMGRIRKAMPLSEVHLVGGLHPEWPFEHYVDIVGKIKRTFPELHLKAFTAAEIDYMMKISGLSLDEVLLTLRSAGLDAMPGGGAEIFAPSVRNRLCPEKITGDRWLEVIEAAHGAGIRTNATMLYGHLEKPSHRVDHLMRLRALQDRTRGFQALIPLSYHPENTETGGSGASGLDDLRTIAVSRLVLDNFAHIKAYWVMLGEKVSQLALCFGADDLDGTVVEEKITWSAGRKSRRAITPGELRRLIRTAGRRPVERDSFYRAVGRKPGA